MARLVDLSNNNVGPTDFEAMRRSGVFGVWHKVSEGTGFTDTDWPHRSEAARHARLHVGGYHFARPELGNANIEAGYFVARLGKVQRRDLCPVLDLEANDAKLSSDQLHLWAATFLARVHEETGVRGIIYSYPAFIRSQGWQRTLGTGRGLWLADYGPDDGSEHPPNVPAPWRRLVAHQFTSRARVAGVPGFVDLSSAERRRAVLAHGLRGLP